MTNTLRIIAGEWRGRRIRFPGRGGIRPTPDRVRETLAYGEVPSASQALGDVFAAVERFSRERADDQTAVVLRRKNERT